MNAVVGGKFSNDPIVSPVFTQLFSDEFSDSSIKDLYLRYVVRLTTDPVNPVAPQLVNHGLSAVNALNKVAGNWIPATRIRSLPCVIHWSAVDHAVGQSVSVGDAVGEKSDYCEEKYKTDFEIWMENSKLQFGCKNIEWSRPPLG